MQCFAEVDKGIPLKDWSGAGCICYHRGTKHYYVTLDNKTWIPINVDPTRGSTKPNTKPDNEYIIELIKQAEFKQPFVWEPIWNEDEFDPVEELHNFFDSSDSQGNDYL